MAETGGLASAIFSMFMVIGREINLEFLKNKITRVLYFVKTTRTIGGEKKLIDDENQESVPLFSFIDEFKYSDTLKDIASRLCFCFCQTKKMKRKR